MKRNVSVECIPSSSSCFALNWGGAPVFAGSSPAASAITAVKLKQLGESLQLSLLILKVDSAGGKKGVLYTPTTCSFLGEVVDTVFEVTSTEKLCV